MERTSRRWPAVQISFEQALTRRESPEARTTHLATAMAAGAYAPALELLARPVRATVIRRLI